MTINGTGPFTEWIHIETYENDLSEKHVPGVPVGLKGIYIYIIFNETIHIIIKLYK